MSYNARYRVDDGYWLVELDEEPRVHSFGRTLAKARANIADAARLFFEHDVELHDVIEMPDDVAKALENAVRLRRELENLSVSAAEATKKAAHRLVDLGYSTRDVGQMLGVSPQRVSQLTKAPG